ncbi:hypothetical protein KM043_010207 [Ampulex compressa]|nr:hypothetical protein KM043_010207 [Ampulex compressa]
MGSYIEQPRKRPINYHQDDAHPSVRGARVRRGETCAGEGGEEIQRASSEGGRAAVCLCRHMARRTHASGTGVTLKGALLPRITQRCHSEHHEHPRLTSRGSRERASSARGHDPAQRA